MEEYLYPIVVEVDWSPEQAKRLKNKLQIYFQSKKKSNGGDCVIQFNEQSGAVTVLFKTSEIRDSVLSKADHVITTENVSVKLKVSKPEDTDNSVELTMQASENQQPSACEPHLKNVQESFGVVLENVSDEANTNVLALLVENVSSVPEKDFSLELIPELNTAVVIFNSPNAAGKFLEESKTHRKFREYRLKARALERSTCVRVENLSADGNNKMLLELYFEKWGGPVEETIIVPLEQAAIITFKNEEEKEKVLKMEHNIFKIYPYYKSLGTALYGRNRPTWKLPEPLKVNVLPAIKKFLLKKGLISSISAKMDQHFCQINMDKPEVLLSPDPVLLKQKGLTRKHIDGWAKNASDSFEVIISNYTAFELQVLHPLWTEAESDIKTLVKDLFFIDMDASKGVLTLAGETHDIIGLKPVLVKMLELASTQMERERNRVTEDVKMTPASPSGSEPYVKNLQETFAVVLENVSDEADRNVLALLVENVSSVPEKDFSLELIPELNTAVVTFNSPKAAGKFLEESRTHKRFQDYGLKARALERSTCVRIENLPAKTNNKMLLELYFEKWGGPVEETIIVPLEQAAIITFKNEEDKKKVLKIKHYINNVLVKIYPYYKSLDTALYGRNRPILKLPEPLKVNVNPTIIRFLFKKRLVYSIRDKMGIQFCQINMDNPEVLLSPDPALLKQKGVTRRHINGWAKNALDSFKDIISNYTAYELQVLHPLWLKAKSNIKELVKDQVFIDMDASKGVLTLAGATHDINDLKSFVEKMLERASTQMERERNSVTEVMEMTPAMYSLLQQDGLQSAITASLQLHIDYNRKMNKLQLSGLKTEILAFKKWVLDKKLSMKEKPLQVDRSLLVFLRSADCDEMSKDLFISHGICAVYTVENGDPVLIGSTGQALSEAEKRLNIVLQSEDITVEDQAVLALPQWHDLHKQLQSSYNTPNKRIVFINLSPQRDKVIVSGFRKPVSEVSRNLGDFIKKHARIEDAVRVQSHAVVEYIKDRKSHDWHHLIKSDEVTVCFDSKRPRIKLSGERRFVQPAMSSLKKMADALFTDTLIIKKAGAKKYFKEEGRYMLSFILKENGFVVVLREDHMLDEEEEDEHKDRGWTKQFQSNMVTDFQHSMHRRPGEKVEKGIKNKFKARTNNLMFWDTSESPRNEEFVMVVEKIEPAIFQLCGETQHDVNKARDMISSLILREYVTIPIRDPAIGHFTKEDEEMLNAMQRELSVSIKLERKDQDPVITLEGLTKDVHAAESRIRDMIRRVERYESKRREAFIISSVVEWKYQDRRQNLKSFDMMTNYDLEKAFQSKKPSLKIKIDNDEYNVDFFRLQATRGRLWIELQRKDLTV